MGQPRNSKYEEAYPLYVSGLSLSQVAEHLKVTRQGVFKAFKKRGYVLRTRIIHKKDIGLYANDIVVPKIYREYQMFDNRKFSLRNSGYFSLTNGCRMLMHRYVWEFYNGKIPSGFDIHHLDGNRRNNDIKNLECLPKAEHTRRYSPHHNQYTKTNVAHQSL